MLNKFNFVNTSKASTYSNCEIYLSNRYSQTYPQNTSRHIDFLFILIYKVINAYLIGNNIFISLVFKEIKQIFLTI